VSPGGSPRKVSPVGLVAAVLVGVVLGLLDFALFELQGNLAGFREYVLYRPGALGLSLLFDQLLAFALLGAICFVLLSLVRLALSGLRRRWGAIPVLPLSSGTLALGMIALRVDLNRAEPYRLAALAVGSGALVLVAFLVRRSSLEEARTARPARSRWAARGALAVLALLLVALFAPDVYSAFLRFGRKGKNERAASPNVLFIVLDAVRADHLSCYGYRMNTTPNIDRIAREGVQFRHAFSAAPWTVPSHASMFTGVYPSQHQAVWGHVYLDGTYPTLAERLRGAGYQTVGFAENAFVGRSFGLTRGFGEFHETWRRPLVVRALARIATRVLGYHDRLDCPGRTIGLFERWVVNNEGQGRPFFAFLNFMSAHLPRYPRPGFGRRSFPEATLARIEPVNLIPERFYVPGFHLDGADLAVMAEIYDSDVAYLDSKIGELMAFLDRVELRDDTIVIVTSDHGENFGEHGLIEHQLGVYDTLLHVPLIVRWPAFLKPQTVERRVSTVRLFDAVQALVRVRPGDAREDSRADPLEELSSHGFVVAEYSNGFDMLRNTLGGEGRGVDLSAYDRSLKCIIEGPYKFIWSSNGKDELYQIDTDPREQANLIGLEPARGRAMRDALSSWELSLPKRPHL
jgi:arylsulfatase A-like enzyme